MQEYQYTDDFASSKGRVGKNRVERSRNMIVWSEQRKNVSTNLLLFMC